MERGRMIGLLMAPVAALNFLAHHPSNMKRKEGKMSIKPTTILNGNKHVKNESC